MAAMAVSYVAAAFVGRAFAFPGALTTLWPPNAVLVGVLIRSDVALWPYLVLATCPASVAFSAWRGRLLLVSLAYWMASMAVSVATASIVRRVHGRAAFRRLVEVVTFALATASSTMVGALIGAAATYASIPEVSVASVWRSWWLSDLLAILTVAPVIASCPWRRADAGPTRLSRECAAFAVVLCAITVTTVLAPALGLDPRLVVQVVAVPVLVWAALRLGVAGTSWAVLVVAALVMWNHVRGVGEFVAPLGFTPDRAVAVQAILCGISVSFLCVAAAVQETRDSATRLVRRDETRRVFVAAMAHEIRNALGIILGNVEIAGDRSAGRHGDAGDDPLRVIDRAARQVIDVVEDVLQASRSEGEAPTVRAEPLWLPGVWRDLEAECRVMNRAPEVALRWSAAVPDVTLVTDRKALVAMIRNLVGNALKFTDRGSVSVECRVDADTAAFVVEDTGIGISADDRERLFELFQRGSDPDALRRPGTGVGLYVVRQYAAQCGGRVTVVSVRGRGSTFTLVLPRTIAAAHVA